ncbi:zinc finger protein 292-like [Cheilinus undulatus]|uniref:zinc finger protein 292-like n=1 Tax=Cheilinus undulatus TaxID=241271 RepID=UPI001BD2A846|nr:zinc finger protein 292-like [Cheilinus undulatus]
MAEEGSVYELEGLEKQLQTLLSRYSSEDLRADSKPFCSDFRKLVEEHASRWQVPLPQLRILEKSLYYFTQAATFFTSNCDHVLHTLSSLALSVFELLLFFDQKDFHEEVLKKFTVTFQECHLALARLQNVHLIQVERLVQGGGPWASSVLQAILSESSLPQSEVDGFISSELPVFFELRVRYLLSCEQRVREAVALAKCCSQHPAAGQHSFFLQVYLTWLLKTSQHERLHREVADLSSKDAIHIICNLECEEKDELLLALCRAFLSQQLRRGDMYYLCDLVLVWSKLHSRLKTSKQALLEESHQLMLFATNVNSIFPFIRAIMQELGEDGIQFCVELCANALKSCLPCDVITKSLIYKTIAGLLPNDLEVCRACALLVFFLERSVEAYKMVYLLYMHPDQEYHVDSSPIRNHVRFETLQVLKKDLYFDPEFWNLIALRTNCLKLMSEKVVSAALEEIMEDKWIFKYCTKEFLSRSSTPVCQKGKEGALEVASSKKRHLKEETNIAAKRLKIGPGRPRLNSNHTKKKGNQGSRSFRDDPTKPLRRSFWQLDRLHDNGAFGSGEYQRTTRRSEKNLPKRRIRKPRWLLEDSGALEENDRHSKMRRHGLKHRQHHRSAVIKRTESAQIKNNAKHKPSVNSALAKDNKNQKGLTVDSVKTANPPQVILELSLPDNELMGTFNDDTSNRQRGLPQVLLYKRTVKHPDSPQPAKTWLGKEVILRARDPEMFIQLLHCYTRRLKGKGNGVNVQSSVSTITRSSAAQGSPPKEPLKKKLLPERKGGITTRTKLKESLEKVSPPQTTKAVLRKAPAARELSGKSDVGMKDTNASHTSAECEVKQAPKLDKVMQGKAITSRSELCEGSAVEMKVTIASQTPTPAKVTESQELVCKAHEVKDTVESATPTEVSQLLSVDKNQTEAADQTLLQTGDDTLGKQEQNLASLSPQAESDKNPVAQDLSHMPELHTNLSNGISDMDVTDIPPTLTKELPVNITNPTQSADTQNNTKVSPEPADQDSINDMSALTLVTEMVTELAPETISHNLENQKPSCQEYTASKETKAAGKVRSPHKVQTTSKVPAPEHGPSPAAKVQDNIVPTMDDDPEDSEPERENEESKLEYCCTFCSKVFKGSRVVAHAMFHYRKDECMFCGTIFKDDLLAMMHLSDHIEKLKRLKDASSNKTRVSVTKDKSTPKTSSKAKPENISPRHLSRGRPSKSTIRPTSASSPDSTPSGSRRLRSSDKAADCPTLKEKKPSESKQADNVPLHKINGHIGVKKKIGRPRKVPLDSERMQERPKDGPLSLTSKENKDAQVNSSAPEDKKISRLIEVKMKEKKSPQVQKPEKQAVKPVSEKNLEPQEKLCCPMDGCAWFTDLSKNRVGLLYHALEDHYGEVKPLKLAFRIGSSKCSICMRVLWSFEHFQHHVEQHRLSPRYPCPHQGCPARFKTGMDMRRHARKHNPLQATCCLPGCSKLFICLWALNLHEREHYTASPTKVDKKINKQTGDRLEKKQSEHITKEGMSPTTSKKKNEQTAIRQKNKQSEHIQKVSKSTAILKKTNEQTLDRQQKKQSEPIPKETIKKTTTLKKTASVKVLPKLRRRNRHGMSTRKHVNAPPQTSLGSSLSKQQTKERSETQESTILKNLSNKETPERPSSPSLRSRQTLQKVSNLPSFKNQKPKVVSSSFKRIIKVRHRLKKKQVEVIAKRRGRPPKVNKAVHNVNKTTGPNGETVKGRTALKQKPKKAAQSLNEGKDLKKEESQQVDKQKSVDKPRIAAKSLSESKGLKKEEGPQIDRATEKSIEKSKPMRSSRMCVKTNQVEEMTIEHKTSPALSVASPSASKARSIIEKLKKLHEAAKRSSLNQNRSQTASSDSPTPKKQEDNVTEAQTESLEKVSLQKEADSAPEKPAESESVIPLVEAEVAVESTVTEEVKKNVEEAGSRQNSSDNSAPAVQANSSTETTEPPTTSGEKTQEVTAEKSKKLFRVREKRKVEKKTFAASSASIKTNKKQKVAHNTRDKKVIKKRQLSKDGSKKPAKKKTKAEQTQEMKVEGRFTEAEGKSKEENVILDGSSVPAATASSSNELTGATEEKIQKTTNKEKSKKPRVLKNSDPNKVKKCKINKGDAKIVKKKLKDPSEPKKPRKTKIKVQSVMENTEERESFLEVQTSAETLEHTVRMPGYSRMTNGQEAREVARAQQFKQTLAEYGKKPYLRAPPEAYLDEKYITMPKRRKEMSPPSQKNFFPEQVKVAVTPQRHRCTNCFATFNSAEELESHVKMQRCSNLFGFDSDDEGNS